MRGRDDKVGLRILSDADFEQHDDRKSFTGYVCMLGPNLVDFWRSRKQALVTTSTTEAELVAMSEPTEDLEWKLGLLKEMTDEADQLPSSRIASPESRS